MGQIKKSYSLKFKHHVVEKFEQGATYNEIKETYGLDLRMFRRWVRKYRDNGLKGLEDRRGRPRKIDDTFEKLLPRGEKIQRLEAEIEFLKKLLEARKGKEGKGESGRISDHCRDGKTVSCFSPLQDRSCFEKWLLQVATMPRTSYT